MATNVVINVPDDEDAGAVVLGARGSHFPDQKNPMPLWANAAARRRHQADQQRRHDRHEQRGATPAQDAVDATAGATKVLHQRVAHSGNARQMVRRNLLEQRLAGHGRDATGGRRRRWKESAWRRLSRSAAADRLRQSLQNERRKVVKLERLYPGGRDQCARHDTVARAVPYADGTIGR